jgi:hypothetical protein
MEEANLMHTVGDVLMITYFVKGIGNTLFNNCVRNIAGRIEDDKERMRYLDESGEALEKMGNSSLLPTPLELIAGAHGAHKLKSRHAE